MSNETLDIKTTADATMTEINEWEDLNAKTLLLRGIYANGFEKPSPIQKQAILPLFAKRDVIAQAQSGTGKTACFSISALELIDTSQKVTQAMILSPTRELSIQTKKVIDSLGSLFPDLSTQLLIGGTSTDDNIQMLRDKTPQIVIGCPGRIHDMLKRKRLSPTHFRLLMKRMNFCRPVLKIKSTIFFSICRPMCKSLCLVPRCRPS